jgi:Cdc6-like AAA superfamily ATPase
MTYSAKALELRRRIDGIRIHHSRFQEALDSVGRTIQLGSASTEPPGLTIVAPSGAGKSLLIECVKNNVCNWPFLQSGNVLIAALKESPSVGQIQDALLRNFNYAIPPRAGRRDNNVLSAILCDSIVHHNIQLIALDEFQHVFLTRKNDVRESVIDWTKRLITQTRCPILLSGTERLRSFENADPQITSRIPTIVSLPAFRNDEEFRGVLNAFATSVTDVNLSSLTTQYATAIFRATEGSMRRLKHLIMEAAMIALDGEAGSIDRKHLELAFRRVQGADTSQANPFK